ARPDDAKPLTVAPRGVGVGFAPGPLAAAPPVGRRALLPPRGASPVQPDRPGIDRGDVQVTPAPRIACERGPDLALRLCFDGMHDALLVGERAAEEDETRLLEAVHEGRVRGPVGLLLQRT